MLRTTNTIIKEASIESLQKAMGSNEISSKQLVQAYIERIKLYDKNSPKLKSIITINPHALEEATKLDQERQNRGTRGPLHGIPVILKDNINTKNILTTGGSVLLKDLVPPNDAFIVEKLRAAGAVILAKSNLTEFARGGTTVSSFGGQTRNPYDLTRTPGGSSGGTGAAIAANLGTIGVGTDTINSVRSPCSANCLVGIKPTIGLISRTGIIPCALTQDTAGPMTRTVTDSAILLDALVGYDPNDIFTAWSINKNPQSYTQYLDKNGLKSARIGILINFFGSKSKHIPVNQVITNAIKHIAELGATTIPIVIPGLDNDELILHYDLQRYESKVNIEDYFASLGELAPVKTIDEWLKSGKYDQSIENSLIEAHQKGKIPFTKTEYRQKIIKRTELQQRIIKLLADMNLDALIFPHQKEPVAPIGRPQVGRNGILGAITGFPAIVVPAGFAIPPEIAPLGVPVGIEFLGLPWSEPKLIKFAYSYEQATKHRLPPASIP